MKQQTKNEFIGFAKNLIFSITSGIITGITVSSFMDRRHEKKAAVKGQSGIAGELPPAPIAEPNNPRIRLDPVPPMPDAIQKTWAELTTDET